MSQPGSNDSYGIAILLLLFGVASGLVLDICAKWLLGHYPLQQFVLLRSLFGLSVFVLISPWYGGLANLRTRHWRAHLLRTVLATGAMFGFFHGLAHMPLVSALTLAFTAPLIVTAMSAPLLGEHVGWRRWLAVIVGFSGVLIVLRPGAGLFNLAAFSVLFAALCYAVLAISARKLAATESTLSLAVYVIVGPLVASSFTVRGHYVTPATTDWLLFALAGLASAGAWIGIIGGYRRAPPSLLAPFEYTALIGGAFAGYWLWDEVPDAGVVTGGLVIIGSGLFIVHREVASTVSGRYLRAFTAGATALISKRFRGR